MPNTDTPQVGDKIKVTIQDIEITGVVGRVSNNSTYYTEAGRLLFSNSEIALPENKVEILERPMPPLPVEEPATVIIATKVKGTRGYWPMFLDFEGDWVSRTEIAYEGDLRQYHDPECIEEWIPAKVVPDE